MFILQVGELGRLQFASYHRRMHIQSLKGDPAAGASAAGSSGTTVLHCIPTLSGGGAEHQLKLLIPRLIARGIRVAVFSRLTGTGQQKLESQGAISVPIRSRGNCNPALAVELVAAIRRLRPDIVQSWLPQMDVLCGFLARSYGAKWILSERCSPLAYPRTAKNWLRRVVGERADLVVANSRHGLAVWNHKAKRVVANAVDLGRIDETPDGYYAGSASLRGRKIVISVARLTEQKQSQVLIEAIRIARERVPELLLLLLGEGPDREQLTAQVAEHGLEDHVHFLGFRTDVPHWMKSADLFVSASLYEGHPNSVLEAAAARLPLLLSDIPEHRDAVGDTACYATPGDAAGFARAMVEIVESRELKETLAHAARGKVDGLTIEAIADEYASIYRDLSAGRTDQASRS